MFRGARLEYRLSILEKNYSEVPPTFMYPPPRYISGDVERDGTIEKNNNSHSAAHTIHQSRSRERSDSA